jgi:hypothetical protein
VLIRAYNSISKVKRYYIIIRQAYFIVTIKLYSISKDIALQMSFKAINDSISPNSLVFTLLVYNTYPRIVKSDSLSLTIL